MSNIPSLLEMGMCPPRPPPPQMNYMMPSHRLAGFHQAAWTHEYRYNRPPPNVTPVNPPTAGGTTLEKGPTNAKYMIDLWLNKHGLSDPPCDTKEKQACPPPYTLLDLKWMVSKLNLVRLKLAETNLSEEMQHSLQQEARNLVQTLANDQTKESARMQIERAKKRKARRQRSIAKKRQECLERENIIDKKHEVLDKWIQSLKEKKQTEEMLKAADRSMSGVRQKISDVKRQKELIESLVKLRKIRADARGMKSNNSNFEKKIADLTLTLTKRLDMYKKEEMALQVMLEHERDEKQAEKERIEQLRKQKQHLKKEKHLKQWLFGNIEVSDDVKPFFQYYTQAEDNFDAFLQIRCGWDSFIVPDEVPGSGSRIPRGWVVPSAPSSQGWAEFVSST